MLHTIPNEGGVDAGFYAFAQGLLWQIQNELYKKAGDTTVPTPLFDQLYTAAQKMLGTAKVSLEDFKGQIEKFNLLTPKQDILFSIKNILRNILQSDGVEQLVTSAQEFFSDGDGDKLLKHLWFKSAREKFENFLKSADVKAENDFEKTLKEMAETFVCSPLLYNDGEVTKEGFQLLTNRLCANYRAELNVASSNSILAKFIKEQSKAPADELMLQFLANYFKINLIVEIIEKGKLLKKTGEPVTDQPTIFISCTDGFWRSQVRLFPHCEKNPIVPQDKVMMKCLRYAREEFSKAEIKDVLEKVYQHRRHHNELTSHIIAMCDDTQQSVADIMKYIRDNIPKDLNLTGHYAACVHYLCSRYDGVSTVYGLRQIVQGGAISKFLKYKTTESLTVEEIQSVFNYFKKSDNILSTHFSLAADVGVSDVILAQRLKEASFAYMIVTDCSSVLMKENDQRFADVNLQVQSQEVIFTIEVRPYYLKPLAVEKILKKIEDYAKKLEQLPSGKLSDCINYVFYRAGKLDNPLQDLQERLNTQAENRQQIHAKKS